MGFGAGEFSYGAGVGVDGAGDVVEDRHYEWGVEEVAAAVVEVEGERWRG